MHYTDDGYEEEYSYHPYYGELQRYYYPEEEERGEPEPSSTATGAGQELSVVDTMGSKFEFYLKLGDFYFKKNQYTEAVDAFKEAVAINPNAAVAYFFLAESLFALGDYQFAAFNIRKGLKLEPGFLDEIIDRRDFYTNPEDFDHQLQELEKFVEKNLYDDEALLVLAYNYYFTKRFMDAKEILLRLGTINPEDTALSPLLAAIEKKLAEEEKKVEMGKEGTAEKEETMKKEEAAPAEKESEK